MAKTLIYTAFALIAFAFNSILCRLALRGHEADAVGFTTVRLVSGAVMLVVISFVVSNGRNLSGSEGARGDETAESGAKNTLPTGRVSAVFDGGSWVSAALIFLYAICFSLAYLDLSAGTGALILFGSVQIAMIGIGIFRGERPRWGEWLGIFVAFGGLIYLVMPGIESPPVGSSILMAAAGTSWAVYTIRGKGSANALADTTGNFVRAVPMIAAVLLIFASGLKITNLGIFLAVVSGAVTSGVGYTVWYAALKFHTSTRAAVLQLSVPVIAAVLGIVLLGETANARLAVASALILGGIAVVIGSRIQKPARSKGSSDGSH